MSAVSQGVDGSVEEKHRQHCSRDIGPDKGEPEEALRIIRADERAVMRRAAAREEPLEGVGDDQDGGGDGGEAEICRAEEGVKLDQPDDPVRDEEGRHERHVEGCEVSVHLQSFEAAVGVVLSGAGSRVKPGAVVVESSAHQCRPPRT